MKSQLNVLTFSLLFFSGNLFSSEDLTVSAKRHMDFNISLENLIISAIRQGKFNKDFIQSLKIEYAISNMQNVFCVLNNEDIPNFKEACDSFFNFYISELKASFGKINDINDIEFIFFSAVRLARVEFMKYAFDNMSDKSDLDYKSALAIAAQAPKKYDGSVHCYMQVLNFLVPKHVDINEKLTYYRYGYRPLTALMIAATYDQPEIVLWLLINGANPDYINNIGESFITIANSKPRILAVFNQYKEYKKHKDSLSKD